MAWPMHDAPRREVVLFNALLELAAEQRNAYLDEAGVSDPLLRRRLTALLAAHERSGSFLDQPAVAADALRFEASDVVRVPPKLQTDMSGERVGPYKLLQQLGEGGCGIVYLAEQMEPVRRQVALKVLKLGMDTRHVIARFGAERQTLALMDHPNIARVLDAGATPSGRPYFVMELVRGIRLTDYCDQNSLSTRQRLDLFIQVCRAVQHAHQKGIIHRDLKPSNILVTVNDGVAVPKVIDFGIAKATQGRLTDQTLFTAFEQFIGTPAYMSPEQSVLTSVDVDTRSDIYSLGVLLYELLTGQTPFSQKELLAAGLDEMRQLIREKEPLRPSTRLSTMRAAELDTTARVRQCEPPRLVHALRGDLDWIVMKCLEKERSRRYDTANGLAMDLSRHLNNEPVLARPPGNLYRFQKFVGRNRLAFGAASAVLAALIVGFGFSTWQYVAKSHAEREQSRLRELAQRARQRAEGQELAARRKAYASDMNLLQLAFDSEDLGRAQQLLEKQRPQPGQPDLRGWEWRYFWQFCCGDSAFTFCRRSNSITAVSFSSDGALLAVGGWADEVTVWDVATRQLIFQRKPAPFASGRLAFAPQGSTLAFHDGSGSNRHVILWDAVTRKETHRLPLGGVLRDLAFGNGGILVTADNGRTNNIALWDVASGNLLRRFTARLAGSGMGRAFHATPDARRFVHSIQGADRSIRVITEESVSFDLKVADELVTALAFSPDGKTLATGGGYAEGTIKLWDLDRREQTGSLKGHQSWVSSLKFLDDGATLASASSDRTIRLWDVGTQRPIRTLHGYGGELWSLDISPDGRWLASGAKDGSVILWDLSAPDTRPPTYRTHNLEPGSYGRDLSPDGKWIGALRHGRLLLYDARTLLPSEGATAVPTNIVTFAFSPDMRLLLTTSPKGHLNVWSWPGQELITNFVAHSNIVYLSRSAFRPDGRSLLTYGGDRMFREWELGSWRLTRQWQIPLPMKHRAIASSADRIVTGEEGGLLDVTTAANPEKRWQFRGQNRVVGIGLSPDGRMLATASENGTVEVWSAEDRTRLASLGGVLLGYHAVTFSPDGSRLAAGSNGREAIKLWDLNSFEEVATLRGEGSFFTEAGFSPDGNTISARNWNGLYHFWTAPSWDEISATEKSQRTGPR